ncbi:S1C family serine protease [Lysinimonas soli]|uniref:S1C family serine protease n=1 Tax=Lysinimonas soli TaxID=1074233 RepID=A0ABW0NLR5_9MICO
MDENDAQGPENAEPKAGPTSTPAEAMADTSSLAPRRRRRAALIGGATAVALAIGAGGFGIGTVIAEARNGSTSASEQSGSGARGGQFGGADGSGQGSSGQGGSGRYPSPRLGGTAALNATAATSAQKVGVVTIVSTLNYDSRSQAAGTGIILNSTGEILTNNHVIEGSTATTVTVESTGTSYTAKVVGTDATDDIAVLQLVDSSGDDVTGLSKAKIDSQSLSVGAAVTSIGNAEGTGNLVAASGTVTALEQSIQVADDTTGATESLSGLIQTNADVVSGDSGGPLIDSQGEVAGVVTAASSGSRTVAGYAIPIDDALSIAKRIMAGEASSTVTIGLPAFLGVELATAQTGAGVLISGVVSGSAAAGSALTSGDTITALNGSAVTTTDSLSALVKSHTPGDTVTVTYTDASGASHQVAVTLAGGPAA